MKQLKMPGSQSLRVVLDTNILVSMLVWRGKAMESLYELLQERVIVVCLIPATLDELRRVLHYSHITSALRRADLSPRQVEAALLNHAIIFESPKNIPRIIKDDPDDDIFLACAKLANATCIISGDNHLLDLKEFKGIPVIKPAVFLRHFSP